VLAPPMPDYKRPESVIVLVHSSCGQVLMLNRVEPADFWQSITGSLEPGESPADAAARELAEETGIEVPGQGQLFDHESSVVFPITGPWLASYAPGITENREHRFSVSVDLDVPLRINPSEHVDFRWLSFSEAICLTGSDSNRDFLSNHYQDLVKNTPAKNS